MKVISIDLPWKEDKKGRRTLAIADLGGNIKIRQASDDNEMLQLARDNTEPGSIILLDIPVDGCENLGTKHFRPVDKALSHQGIWTQPVPSYEKNRGKKLEELLTKSMNRRECRVYEIYPYAIYKFLAFLECKKLLQRLKLDKFDTLLNDKFRGFRPRKYKREKKKDKRLENTEYLYSLLTDSSIGLNFSPPLRHPDTSYTLNGLSELCDEYDACLGTIVGIYFANNSRYACIAGDSNSGNILLLADRWLSKQLSKQVRVYRKGVEI